MWGQLSEWNGVESERTVDMTFAYEQMTKVAKSTGRQEGGLE